MRPSLDNFKSSSIQGSDERIEAFSIFYGDIWGGANMREVSMWGSHFCQHGSIASNGFTGHRNYRWADSSSKHGLRSDLQVPNLKKISWGSMPPDSPSFFTLMHTLIRHQWPYQFKIAGSGPDSNLLSGLLIWRCRITQYEEYVPVEYLHVYEQQW